jgi:hypothetical protein
LRSSYLRNPAALDLRVPSRVIGEIRAPRTHPHHPARAVVLSTRVTVPNPASPAPRRAGTAGFCHTAKILRFILSDRDDTGPPPPPQTPARTLRRAGWHPARADGRRRKPQAVGLSARLTVENPVVHTLRPRRHWPVLSTPGRGPQPAGCQWHPARADRRRRKPQAIGLSASLTAPNPAAPARRVSAAHPPPAGRVRQDFVIPPKSCGSASPAARFSSRPGDKRPSPRRPVRARPAGAPQARGVRRRRECGWCRGRRRSSAPPRPRRHRARSRGQARRGRSPPPSRGRRGR